MKTFRNELKIGVVVTALIGVLACGLYPLLVFVVAQGVFPEKANGSLIYKKTSVVGSRLIGQAFTGPRYFHPRPSAAGDGYDAANSSGSNLGPTSKKLIDTVRERVEQYRSENQIAPDVAVPADAVMASGSGLDPDISPRNAALQASRVARERGQSVQTVQSVIERCTHGRDLGILGEPRVNVVELNLALDEYPTHG